MNSLKTMTTSQGPGRSTQLPAWSRAFCAYIAHMMESFRLQEWQVHGGRGQCQVHGGRGRCHSVDTMEMHTEVSGVEELADS